MRWPRRRRDGRSRFESGLLSVMGPASIGDPSAPLTYLPPDADLLCPRCGQPWDDHRVVRTDTTTIAHCPPPEQEVPGS